jgi:OmpA-OmpF porin, OOP family
VRQFTYSGTFKGSIMARRQLAAKTANTLFAGLLSFSLGTISTAHAAEQDPGWYFGLQGGVNTLSDSTNTQVQAGDPGTPAGPPGILGVIFPDAPLVGPLVPTVCDLLGALLCDSDEPGPVGPGSESSFTTGYKNGTVFGINIGHAYKSGLRPEFSLNYRSNDVESVAFGPGNGDLSGQTTTVVDGSTTSISALGNIWFDFNRGGTFRPYLGVGLGAAQVGYDSFQIGASTIADDKATVVAYQAGAGFGFNVGDNTVLSLDLRYLAAGDADIKATNGDTITLEYGATSAMLGLRYYLREGALAPLDSDGDGVPDDQDKCPDTPLGITVGPDGCPNDADGDGVPDSLDKCPGTPAGVTVGPDGCPIDSDKDGVPDYLDKCPGTAPGVQVGPDGCPLDSDGDGTPDSLDKCPGTPAGAIVDANGCEPDSDGDGVPDRLDRCPDTLPGEKVGPTGCPNDSDGDGVPDDLDECPNTPPGAQVLANGCALKGDCRTPRPGEEVDENGCAVDQTFILRGVNFEFDSDRLTPEAKVILRQVAQTLKAYPDVDVEVAGHTDSTGTDAYNLSLSEKRSISVKNFLTGEGVEARRMTPTGYGESQPIDTNDTEDGQARNRRVELRVIDEPAAGR